MTSIVNMSSPEVIHGGLGNLPPHESAPPETNQYVKEGDIFVEDCLMPSGNMNFQGRELESSLMHSAGIGVNNSMPSASNPNPNMISAMTSIVNMSSPEVIRGGLGNFPPHENVPPETNQYVKEGDILGEDYLMPSGNMNFQGRQFESSLMLNGGIGVSNWMPSGNMNFQGRELESSLMSSAGIGVNNSMPSASNPVPNMLSSMTRIVKMSPHKVIRGGLGNFPQHESVPPETNQYVKQGDFLVEDCLMPSGNMNFQGRELESSLMSSAGIGVNNSMPSASNPVPNMKSIANRSVLKDFNEEIGDLRQHGGFTYSTGDTNFQEIETSTRAGNHDTLTHASMMNTANMPFTRHGVTPATNSMNFQGGGFSIEKLKPHMMIGVKMSIASTSSHEAISKGQANYSDQESEGLLNCNRMNDSRRSIGIKRSSEAREKGTEEQSLEPKNKKLTLEELGERDGKQINKIMTDRLNRQIEQDKKSDMELVHTKKWPLKEDVQVIRQECKKIAKTCDLNTNEAKQKLLGEAKNLETTQKAREDFGNPSTNMDHIVKNLSLYFDGQFIEAVKKKFSPDLGNGRSARSPPVHSAFIVLENQVYDQGNKQVEPEDFQGLPEELKKLRWGEIPSYLQPIASQIVKDFAKVEFRHITALVLFCAAVKEMEDFPAEKLDLDTLKKWGATLKKAKEVGFQVGFADDLLRKNLLAYFAHTQILGGS
ncbi:hypothetical protein ES319_A11G352400v1 [Gossypium barbadense]|uniref:Uncharacterized protein n=1 Tax=Gossypium barbadense TaxID=3634 RepID=A0A5J5TYW3_GOSBA|nr:hypothetical protein ES319_A11G352400v1 [Gossypium barbadense]